MSLVNTIHWLLEVEVLRQQVSNYEKDKLTLQLTKQRLLQAEKQFKNVSTCIQYFNVCTGSNHPDNDLVLKTRSLSVGG